MKYCPTIPSKEALRLGLSFGLGVEVATATQTNDPGVIERCPPSAVGEPACICGLRYGTLLFESKGSVTFEGDPGACLGQPSTFDVTSPQMTGGNDGGMEILSVCAEHV